MNDNKENEKHEWDIIIYGDGSKLEKRVLEPLIPKERLGGFINDYQKNARFDL